MKYAGRTLLALLVVTITVAALWFTNRAVTPKEVAFDDVLAEAKRGGYHLIKTEDLWERYKKERY